MKFKRCMWMVHSKGWKACGRKATHLARATGEYLCEEHRARVFGWFYKIVKLK